MWLDHFCLNWISGISKTKFCFGLYIRPQDLISSWSRTCRHVVFGIYHRTGKYCLSSSMNLSTTQRNFTSGLPHRFYMVLCLVNAASESRTHTGHTMFSPAHKVENETLLTIALSQNLEDSSESNNAALILLSCLKIWLLFWMHKMLIMLHGPKFVSLCSLLYARTIVCASALFVTQPVGRSMLRKKRNACLYVALCTPYKRNLPVPGAITAVGKSKASAGSKPSPIGPGGNVAEDGIIVTKLKRSHGQGDISRGRCLTCKHADAVRVPKNSCVAYSLWRIWAGCVTSGARLSLVVQASEKKLCCLSIISNEGTHHKLSGANEYSSRMMWWNESN